MEANQIVIAEILYSSAFSDIAISRTLLRRQLQIIRSSHSTILSSDRVMNNLPFEPVDLAGARRVDLLQVIPSHTSVAKLERRRAYQYSYCRKCSARLQSSQFKCGPPAVEPRTTILSSGFADCESASSDSDFIAIFLVTSSKEVGVTSFIDSVASTYSNSGCNAASEIASFSTSEKLGVIT